MFKTTLITATLTLGLTLGLTACGGNQKSAKKATNLTQEHNSLLAWVNGAGVPSSTWSKEQLDTYEANLNRLERSANDARRMSGKDGVLITGGVSPMYIEVRRQLLNDARTGESTVTVRSGSRLPIRRTNLEEDELKLEDLKTDDASTSAAPEIDPLEPTGI